MKLYNFDPDTGEFTGETTATRSPLQPGVYLDQAFATRIAPPMAEVGKSLVFSEGAWGQIEDRRGEVWYDSSDGAEVTVDFLGDPTDHALLSEKPDHTPPLAERRKAKRADLVALRDQKIYAGIVISGIPVQTDEKAQGRITGAALSASRDPAYSVKWKTAAGAFVTLTAPEILAIADAVRNHVQTCFDREAVLVDAIIATDNPELVDIDDGWPGE